jgi:hypothetical protein
LQDFGIQHAETLQSLQIKINKNRQEKRGFIQFLTGDYSFSLLLVISWQAVLSPSTAHFA